MSDAPKKVYIKNSEETYTELTNEEHCIRQETDEGYRAKKFLLIDDYLMEVSEEDYKAFHKENEQVKYIKKRDKKHGLTLVEEFSEFSDITSEMMVFESLEESNSRTAINKLSEYVLLLDKKDQEIIRALYVENLTEKQLGERLGVKQQTIHKKKKRILKKLKSIIDLIEN